MTQPFDERGAELRELFFETAQELIQSLNEDALKLEKAPQDSEIIRSIRRTVHTLKGDAAAVGFRELSELAHAIEDALAAESVSGEVSLAEVGFTAADTFGVMLVAYREKTALPDAAPLKHLVQQLASGVNKPKGRKARKSADVEVVWTEYEKLSAEAARSEGKKVFHIIAHIDPLCAMPIAARQLVTNALASVAQILGARPESGATAETKQIDLLVGTSQADKLLIGRCEIPTVIKRVECVEFAAATPGNFPANVEAVVVESADKDQSQDRGAVAHEGNNNSPRSAAGDNILRVDAERIDNVLNLVGELIIGKSMLQQIMQEFAGRFPKDPLRLRMSDALGIQARVLNDLQRSVMKIRMVPVEQLFRRFPRIVRDTAQRCGKEVGIELNGQDTDLDKGLLDAIAEPLTHIVRNAVSHGLESAADRKQAGKPSGGKIVLNAYHQANQLIVEVSDDGRGVDAEKVKAKAVKTGLISASEAEQMTRQEILDLVFRPGFSTADEVTEISGRGVGLDVVRTVLNRLKGSVELETQPGEGTKFRLKLPLTLAIIKALLFRVTNRLYAIPLNTVAEIARARESDLHRVDKWDVIQLRGEVLPLMRLGEGPSADVGGRQGKIFVLVIHFGGRKWGLIVDALEGEEELVIKTLDDQTIATDLVSGASILGDGRVVLIMNLAAVVSRFTAPGRERAPVGLFNTKASPTLAEVRP
ncbi:MAG TPA: chemotaxis protein CheA [Terriglobales bacterium]|jgi:two-component system chemotaxis sensor kinase CheA